MKSTDDRKDEITPGMIAAGVVVWAIVIGTTIVLCVM